jgi:hypothetical protein
MSWVGRVAYRPGVRGFYAHFPVWRNWKVYMSFRLRRSDR